MMFSTNLTIKGSHAKIIRKYSKTQDQKDDWKLKNIVIDEVIDHKNNLIINKNNDDEDILNSTNISVYIFDTMIDCVITATLIGILENVKEFQDDVDVSATIMHETLSKKTYSDNFKYIGQLLQFINCEKDQIDETVKKVFSQKASNQKLNLEELLSFARGGLTIIDNYFKDCENLEDFYNVLYDFTKKYIEN